METATERADALAAVDDLRGLDSEGLAVLGHLSRFRRYQPGDIISDDGKQSVALCCLVNGLVDVSLRTEHRRAPITYHLTAGGMFGEDALHGRGMMGAVALRQTDVLEIQADDLRRAAERLPAVHAILHRLARIHSRAPWLVDRLREAPLFSNVAPRHVYALLEGTDLQEFGADEVVLEPTDDPGGMIVVLRGQVRLTHPGAVDVGGTSRRSRGIMLGRGTVLGDMELATLSPLLQELRAGPEGCELVVVPARNFSALLASDPSFQRSILASPALTDDERSALEAVHARADRDIDRSRFLAVLGDVPGLPLRQLVDWLGSSLNSAWGDRVAVIHLDRTAPRVSKTTKGGGWRDGLAHLSLHPDVDPLAERAVAPLILEADIVLIDPGTESPEVVGRWLGESGQAVFLASQAYAPVPNAVLDAVPRPLRYTAVVPAPRPQPGVNREMPRGTARISGDLIEAARRATPLESLDGRLRAQLDRWGRALTDRRVGVALGGGGALAFAHCALIEDLHARGIPIDMVAGVSGGSLVGAWYAAKGLAGMDELMALGTEVLKKMGTAWITSSVIANMVDKELGDALLEDLLVPFFPVAADIDLGTQVSIRVGPIGFGVRASGSFPGPFTPTTLSATDRQKRGPWQRRSRHQPALADGDRPYQRLVDGGVINNIPDDTLYLEGCQVVAASNVIPGPIGRELASSRWVLAAEQFFRKMPRLLGRLAREFDMSVRLDDITRTSLFMLHQPDDWAARTADGKFRAVVQRFSPTDWTKGPEIREAQRTNPLAAAALDACVDSVDRHYRALRWQRPAAHTDEEAR